MSIRFRKRTKILPGVHVNFSKSGASLNVGKEGANISLGKDGAYSNVGIPGTGVYSRTKIKDSDTGINILTIKQWEYICYIFAAFFFVVFFLGLNFDWAFGSLALLLSLGFILSRVNKWRISKAIDDELEELLNFARMSEDHQRLAFDSLSDRNKSLVLSNLLEETAELIANCENIIKEKKEASVNKPIKSLNFSEFDPLFEEAARLIISKQQGSTSLIQRSFSIGYNRAGRLMDQLESVGIVSSFEEGSRRKVLCESENDLYEILKQLN